MNRTKPIHIIAISVSVYLVALIVNSYYINFNATFIGVIMELFTLPALGLLFFFILYYGRTIFIKKNVNKTSYIIVFCILLLTAVTIIFASLPFGK